MTPQPAASTHLPLDPAITEATLATFFGANRADPGRDHTSTPPYDVAGLVAVLRPRDPLEAAYATRAAASHYGSVEGSRRALLPEVPDEAALRLHGKALALSRMNMDMVRMLKECQAAAPRVQPQPAARPAPDLTAMDLPTMDLPTMDLPAALEEMRRRAAAVAAKPVGGRDPMSSERPLSRLAASAVRTQLAAALAAKPVGKRDPKSSERASFVPAACVLTTRSAATSFLSAPPPRQSLRSELLGSTVDVAAVVAAVAMRVKPHVN